MFHWLEKHPFFFAVGVFVVIAFAGLIEIVPNFAQASRPVIGTKPISLLEQAGRDVYIKNSCNACHSQLIRPFKAETDRYGHYSLSGEYAYDRPFLWGSKRTGPDLHRVGNYRTTEWHENHMKDPKSVMPSSIMPGYPWMFTNSADIDTAYATQLTNAQFFGVPYNKPVPMKDGSTTVVKMADSVAQAHAMALEEAKKITAKMKDQDVKDAVAAGKIPEIVALIAYLNSLK
ncbi:cytochrome-c oxidase, cbb3-type subunit II [Sulfurimonas hydrogeniphila]|uniref:cytochrome-c oxidase, cbb3-type subunit II n=1 Tax=Sulfurimonas TaxID=202746 RepID=UPI00125F8384|nr:cytochrome-c oxidase, cbb3-type subunit II [Sulfurimonas hydrogeniphila]